MITNEEVKDMLKKADSTELEESVMTYPENEREGRDDYQILADEVSWILHKYGSVGWFPYDELMEAKEILRRTKRGKVIPVHSGSFKPIYDEWKVQEALWLDEEVKRLKRLRKKLESKGYYGRW